MPSPDPIQRASSCLQDLYTAREDPARFQLCFADFLESMRTIVGDARSRLEKYETIGSSDRNWSDALETWERTLPVEEAEKWRLITHLNCGAPSIIPTGRGEASRLPEGYVSPGGKGPIQWTLADSETSRVYDLLDVCTSSLASAGDLLRFSEAQTGE